MKVDPLKVLLVVACALLYLCLATTPAHPSRLAPAMTCTMQDYPREPVCEVHHYFQAWLPRWEVYLDKRLVAKGQGMKFYPVLDERWRTISVSYPAGQHTTTLSVVGRLMNGKTQFILKE